MQDLNERRLENRLGKSIPLQIMLENRNSFQGETVNVSNRGLACRVPCHVPPFSRLVISLDMPFPVRSSVNLKLDALVVRAEKCRGGDGYDVHDLGLFFLNLDQKKATIIEEFLNQADECDSPEPTSAMNQKNSPKQGSCVSTLSSPQGFLQAYKLTRLDRSACFSDLATVLAHEIKNPLACLAGSLQVLGDDIRDLYPSDDLFSELLSQIERIDNTLDHLLQFSASEPSRKDLVRVEDVINGTLGLLGETLRGKNIKVDLCHGSEQPFISADERLLRQAFLHIFADIIDEIEPDGCLSVNTHWADKSPVCDRASCECFAQEVSAGLSVVVMKSGCKGKYGKKNMLPLVERKKKGLSLALTQQIIEQHQGSLFVQSPSDENSILLVFLPL